jgi:DNA-binding response OmpR family regulator
MTGLPDPVRVLLVEDDVEIVRALLAALRAKGYHLWHAHSLAVARRRLGDRRYNAIILDLALPDGCGMDLADEIRRGGSDTPIIMLTAQNAVEQRVSGLQHGADDYVCKPFAVPELIARLQAVMRRASAQATRQLTYADVELDLLTRTVRRGGVEETLSARETDLLAYLLMRSEQVLARDRILEEVWGGDAQADSNVVNVYINYLRNKLEQLGGDRIIHSVRGVGYQLSTHEPDGVG